MASESVEEQVESSNLLTPNSGAGFDFGKYSFSQSLSTVDIYVPLKGGIKSKDVDVKISAGALLVGLKGMKPVLDGKLPDRVKTDDCTWTLIDNNTAHIYLEKQDNMKWWSCVVIGEPEIDTKKVVPENSKLSDLDGDVRQTVEKMMYDQRAKQMGLPTSDEKQKMEMLNKFKELHPEMDFSGAKINFGNNDGGFNFGNN
jgi:hypothetical protein